MISDLRVTDKARGARLGGIDEIIKGRWWWWWTSSGRERGICLINHRNDTRTHRTKNKLKHEAKRIRRCEHAQSHLNSGRWGAQGSERKGGGDGRRIQTWQILWHNSSIFTSRRMLSLTQWDVGILSPCLLYSCLALSLSILGLSLTSVWLLWLTDCSLLLPCTLFLSISLTLIIDNLALALTS